MGNSEIKDKTSLIEARKRIERKMEQFKATEKELKTKAFSKEGLSRAGADDPRAAMREWIAEACERLTSEVEICEAEIDDEYARNKKSQDLERIAQLEDSRKRNKFHVAKLELVRALGTGRWGASCSFASVRRLHRAPPPPPRSACGAWRTAAFRWRT